jgi:putative ABC transport system permease protein
MRLNDIIKLSMNSLSHRGLRSWLTILGIVIGVAAVVSIISIGLGTQQIISSQLGGLGADIITISSGFERAFGGGFGGPGGPGREREQATTTTQNLTTKDVQIIKSVSGVQFVNGIISDRLDVSYLGQSASVSVQGVDPLAWREITTSELESGRYLTPSDENAIVIGNRVAEDMFKKPLVLNTQISIEGKTFSVVGILKASGSFGGGGGSDNTIFMPISAARTIVEDMGTNQFSSIQAKVADAELVNETMTSIEEKLMLSRHQTASTKDFTITSSQAMQETISSVMSTMNLFLTGIAAISLLVGAIGIANTMFMSVMERTRQIGTLKALGATNFEVMKLFVFESAMIGFMGGLIGIFLGFIAAGTISELGIRMIGTGMRGMGESMAVITPELILFSIGFSVVIGALSGLLPARRAASLQPVEALRYE